MTTNVQPLFRPGSREDRHAKARIAMREGQAAREAGETFTANPYDYHAEPLTRAAWRFGWSGEARL